MNNTIDNKERFEAIKAVGEEIITEDDLKQLLEEKEHPVAYDGFEPSGRIHIAQGLLRAININKLTTQGIKFKMLIADWHAWANDKFGGDFDKIQTAGKYFIEVWKACGMNLEHVEFVWVSDYVNDDEYWKKVMSIARNNTVNRIVRCSQIMGRNESDSLSAAQIFYPCMQAADIFHLGVDICQLGMDQRKVNMLAREVAEKLGYKKPIAIHHHMLMGLQEPPKDKEGIDKAIAMKMSKSNPDSAIFMTDSEEEVTRKIQNAYCPQGQVEDNPILEYAKYIIFERLDTIEIKRPEKFGGNLSYLSYEELENDFTSGNLHPMDLKTGVSAAINILLQDVRDHFAAGEPARLKKDVESFS